MTSTVTPKGMIKAFAKAGLSVLGVGYYLTVGRWFWRGSTLRRHQRSAQVMPCPVCGCARMDFRCSVPIMNNLGLFDARPRARDAYTLSFLPSGKVKEKLKEWERLSLFPGGATVDYFRCGECDVFFQNQSMTSEARKVFYEEFYRDGAIFGRDHAYYPGSRFHLWGDYLKNRAGLHGGAKFLDVGCGEGFLPLRMKELGFEAYGIEPSAPMVQYGRDELGLETLSVGLYDRDSYPKGFFDLVNMYHVIEHVDDHRAFVDAAAWHLKVGGCLVVSTPCPEAAHEKLKSGVPVATLRNVLGGGHHLLFSKRYLASLLRGMRFEIVGEEVVSRESGLLPGKRIAPSGEKWLGMNLVAQKKP